MIAKKGAFSPLWDELMDRGRKLESEKQGIAHSMTAEQVNELVNTIDWKLPAGVPDPMALNAQMKFDLGSAKYRLFDLTGMVMDGRWGEDLTDWGNDIAKAYVKCADLDQPKNRKELYKCVLKRLPKEILGEE